MYGHYGCISNSYQSSIYMLRSSSCLTYARIRMLVQDALGIIAITTSRDVTRRPALPARAYPGRDDPVNESKGLPVNSGRRSGGRNASSSILDRDDRNRRAHGHQDIQTTKQLVSSNNHLTTSSLIAIRIASTSHSCFLEPLESRYITNTKDARPYSTIQPSRLVSTFPSRPCSHPHLLPISVLLLFATFAFSSIRFETCEHQRVW
jgi:hypothetical protein